MAQTQHLIPMAGGGQIALYHLQLDGVARRNAPPLIITHGTLSNIDTVQGLAQFLAQLGFDCWLLEWGGHGLSQASHSRQNFEYPAFHDVPTAITAVLQQTTAPHLFWVSHSGGGLLPLMYLARHPEQQKKLAGLVTLGAQTTHAARSWRQKVTVSVLWLITTLLGQTPKALSVGNEAEPTRLLAQWVTWNIREQWQGHDGFNYLSALSHITVPTLIVAGGKDTIAPVSGCRLLFEALGAEQKEWLLCAQTTGFSKDFTHGQLVRSRAARDELFPKIGTWLHQQI